MPITLTTGFTLPNGMRLEFPGISAGLNDDTQTWTVRVQLRTTVPSGNRLICQTEIAITDGPCIQLSKQASPSPGLNIEDTTHYFVRTGRNVATGYTDAAQAMRNAANTPAARRAALEAHLYSAGHLDSSLAGT
jgi:hypothetical protein